MTRFLTHLRLPLLALATSFALTSCSDCDKKHDPRPSAGKCGTPKAPTTTSSGGNS